MLNYVIIAAAARFFSVSRQTRRLYRRIGNVVLERQRLRSGFPERYVERAKLLFELCERHHVLQDGARVLEIGTGWVHWEGMIARVLYDVELTLFDVWDNRLWKTYKEYFAQLEQVIDTKLHMSASQRSHAHVVLSLIARAKAFDEVYKQLGAEYIVEPSGTLSRFKDESFDLIVSCDVLEHVDRQSLPQFTRDFFRVLKPGGHCIHQIDIADHFAYFAPTANRKTYYRYSDRTWRAFFENTVQYFNRVQRPEWTNLFHQAGLELVEEQILSEDIGGIKVHPQYHHLTRQDRECMTMRVVYRKRA